MNRYRGKLKSLCQIMVVLTAIGAFVAYFRQDFGKLLKASWAMTASKYVHPCTPEDRFEYLQQHPGKIHIAMIGDWKQLKEQGRPRQELIDEAVRQVNGKGGIDGRLIVAEWFDTCGSADAMMEIINKIAYDPSIYAIVGPNTSGQLLTAKPLLENYKLLTFAPSVSNVQTAPSKDYPCIFKTNSSDSQVIQAIIDWAREGNRDSFLLINENQTFAIGFSRLLEKYFNEQMLWIQGRIYFTPGKHISYYENEIQNYSDYFHYQHAIFINYSKQKGTYEVLANHILQSDTKDIFFYGIPNWDFTEEQSRRMFTVVYFKDIEQMRKFIAQTANIPNAASDPFALATYKIIFILADACSQAESLRQDDVIQALCNKELQGPFSPFRFNESCFEATPELQVISLHDLNRLRKELTSE